MPVMEKKGEKDSVNPYTAKRVMILEEWRMKYFVFYVQIYRNNYIKV